MKRYEPALNSNDNDSKALRDELDSARILFLFKHDRKSRQQLAKRIKRLEQIIDKAKRLRDLLSDADGSLRLQMLDGESADIWLPRVVDRASKALANAESIRTDTDVDEWSSKELGQLSAREWLVGVELPRVREKYFGKIDSAYVPWAMEILARWGIPYSAASVSRAMRYGKKRTRRNRERRRKAGKSN